MDAYQRRRSGGRLGQERAASQIHRFFPFHPRTSRRHRLQVHQGRAQRDGALGPDNVDPGTEGRFGIGSDLLRFSPKQLVVADPAHQRQIGARQSPDLVRRPRLRIPVKTGKPSPGDRADTIRGAAANVEDDRHADLRRQPAVDGSEEIDVRLRTTKVAHRMIRQEDAIRPGLDLRVGKTDGHLAKPIDDPPRLSRVVQRTDQEVLDAEVVVTLGPTAHDFAAHGRVVPQPFLEQPDSIQRHTTTRPVEEVVGDANVILLREDRFARLGHRVGPTPANIAPHRRGLMADRKEWHHDIEPQNSVAGNGQDGHFLRIQMRFGKIRSHGRHQFPAGNRCRRAENRLAGGMAAGEGVEERLAAHGAKVCG